MKITLIPLELGLLTLKNREKPTNTDKSVNSIIKENISLLIKLLWIEIQLLVLKSYNNRKRIKCM